MIGNFPVEENVLKGERTFSYLVKEKCLKRKVNYREISKIYKKKRKVWFHIFLIIHRYV